MLPLLEFLSMVDMPVKTADKAVDTAVVTAAKASASVASSDSSSGAARWERSCAEDAKRRSRRWRRKGSDAIGSAPAN
jgi:hypothetical protein